MFSGFKSMMRTVSNLGDNGFPKLKTTVENFINAFNEFSHNEKFDIFVCDLAPGNFRNMLVRRLQKLDEFPIPFEKYKSMQLNNFSFYLEHWGASNYSALVLGPALLTPINRAVVEVCGKDIFNTQNCFHYVISNDDPPSKRELKMYFAQNRDECQSDMKIKLGKRELEFNKKLEIEILPIWRSAPIAKSWYDLKNSPAIELPNLI